MQQALKEANDINRMIDVIKNTKSEYLKRDYSKAIRRKTKELQRYCFRKNIPFEQLNVEKVNAI